MGRLEGKVAMITGGTHGAGEGIAHRFGKECASDVVASRSDEKGERVVRELRHKRSLYLALQKIPT